MVVFDCLDVLHAAITNFISSKNILLMVWFLGRWVPIRCKRDSPIIVVTFLLYGGLNHITSAINFIFPDSLRLARGRLIYCCSLFYLMYLHNKLLIPS